MPGNLKQGMRSLEYVGIDNWWETIAHDSKKDLELEDVIKIYKLRKELDKIEMIPVEMEFLKPSLVNEEVITSLKQILELEYDVFFQEKWSNGFPMYTFYDISYTSYHETVESSRVILNAKNGFLDKFNVVDESFHTCLLNYYYKKAGAELNQDFDRDYSNEIHQIIHSFYYLLFPEDELERVHESNKSLLQMKKLNLTEARNLIQALF